MTHPDKAKVVIPGLVRVSDKLVGCGGGGRGRGHRLLLLLAGVRRDWGGGGDHVTSCDIM